MFILHYFKKNCFIFLKLLYKLYNVFYGYCYEIYYNKNDYVSTSKMVIPLNVDNMIYDRNIPEINLENAKENYEMLLKFNYYTDVIRSEKYNLLLTGYEDNKNDF